MSEGIVWRWRWPLTRSWSCGECGHVGWSLRWPRFRVYPDRPRYYDRDLILRMGRPRRTPRIYEPSP